MKVEGKQLQTIWLDETNMGIVHSIDQRKLPFGLIVEEFTTLDEVCIAIKDMHLRGAPLIGVAAAFGIYLSALRQNEAHVVEAVQQAADTLISTRPTAVNLHAAVNRQLQAVKNKTVKQDIVDTLLQGAQSLRQEEIKNCYNIGKHGLELIKAICKKKSTNKINILTHCNAGWLACVDYGTATAPIYLAHEAGIEVHVWIDETRPRNQGARLTAWELGQHGVPHTVIADNTGGHLMQHGMVDMVIVGSDRTTRTGDVANKIGTYLKALAAHDNNVPFYAALPSTTIDWNLTDGVEEIPIETRDQDEVRLVEGFVDGDIREVRICPEASHAVNYGFDVTPARLVTGIITEKGVCEASEEGLSGLFHI